jgi:hypothetical protein
MQCSENGNNALLDGGLSQQKLRDQENNHFGKMGKAGGDSHCQLLLALETNLGSQTMITDGAGNDDDNSGPFNNDSRWDNFFKDNDKSQHIYCSLSNSNYDSNCNNYNNYTCNSRCEKSPALSSSSEVSTFSSTTHLLFGEFNIPGYGSSSHRQPCFSPCPPSPFVTIKTENEQTAVPGSQLVTVTAAPTASLLPNLDDDPVRDARSAGGSWPSPVDRGSWSNMPAHSDGSLHVVGQALLRYNDLSNHSDAQSITEKYPEHLGIHQSWPDRHQDVSVVDLSSGPARVQVCGLDSAREPKLRPKTIHQPISPTPLASSSTLQAYSLSSTASSVYSGARAKTALTTPSTINYHSSDNPSIQPQPPFAPFSLVSAKTRPLSQAQSPGNATLPPFIPKQIRKDLSSHHRGSKDISQTREKAIGTRKVRFSKNSMDDCQRQQNLSALPESAALEEILQLNTGTAIPNQHGISLMTAVSDIPRYCNNIGASSFEEQDQTENHTHQEFMVDSPLGLPVVNLHEHYAYGGGGGSSGRSHSLSSFQNPTGNVGVEGGEIYTLRRASDPSDTIFIQQPRPENPYPSPAEFGRGWSMQQQQQGRHIFPAEQNIQKSPATMDDSNDTWWDGKAGYSLGEEWARSGSEVVAQHLASISGGHQQYTTAPSTTRHSPAVSFEDEGHHTGMRCNSTEPYSAMICVSADESPSPLLDADNDYSMLNSGIKSSPPAGPSPPESPGYRFSAASESIIIHDLGFSPPPTELCQHQQQQACFGGPYPTRYEPHRHAHAHTRQFHSTTHSIPPPTPPSRPSSTNTPTSVIAAATAALNATNTSKSAKPKSGNLYSGRQSSTIPTLIATASSRRKASNSSMRSSSGKSSIHHHHLESGTEMSFVNFTPNDATRILSGVAPSGSSKTKARREREAMEKRKKLSEAAAAMVLAAGGDASALAKVDLL